MASSERILVAGSSGYLGAHIIRRLLSQQSDFVALARNKTKLVSLGLPDKQIIEAQVTEPTSLTGICEGIDVVISCLGITRQSDGLSYMDVDYQANLNLLKEAEQSGVRKFIYISALNAQKFPGVRLLSAKERFVRRLLNSGKLAPCVIRPNGFFSDLEEIYKMAESGRVYLFGRGDIKMNPIHGSDLATFCIESIGSKASELDIGGPDILSGTDIAKLAFESQNKTANIIFLPDWIRSACLFIAKRLPEKWGGPAEFFLTMMEQDAIAPTCGEHHLKAHFCGLSDANNN
ncbi:SDR family oxidoreductase [Thalassomonas viridans]|uniref:SDR family oxidoreductase n=1 Tax=Thalassomonas viridans TaxID=137584 RepID=A0AAF0CDH2_9GAMM|nr:SDR family oxidoreductase [Thalassomonas viridans]WDE08595.1 SDR family oxidoreductase [Thalassomonas viridans]